ASDDPGLLAQALPRADQPRRGVILAGFRRPDLCRYVCLAFRYPAIPQQPVRSAGCLPQRRAWHRGVALRHQDPGLRQLLGDYRPEADYLAGYPFLAVYHYRGRRKDDWTSVDHPKGGSAPYPHRRETNCKSYP